MDRHRPDQHHQRDGGQPDKLIYNKLSKNILTMSREGILWIGALEPYMTEAFLRDALSLMGEDESLNKVKLIRNKFTNELATYGFLQFDSDAAALMTMHKLNGKMIPNSQPPVRFQLNHASAKQSGSQYTVREFSIWVSDLPGDITEEEFKKTFSTRYDSIKSAKLMEEKGGRRYGFVRFTDMNDQREALIHMNGFHGLGQPIKVSMAIPKPCLSEATMMAEKQSSKFQHMYEDYQYDRGAWGNYGAFQSGGGGGKSGGGKPLLVSGSSKAGGNLDWDLMLLDEGTDSDASDNDEEDLAGNRLIEHDMPVNVDAMNAEFIERSQEVWDAVEKDRWIYNLENDEGMAPNFRQKDLTSKKTAVDVIHEEAEEQMQEQMAAGQDQDDEN